jgi:hypothetical protein
MFNNVALDVAIGLVMVYLLYSLLITIIGEMVATWMALRARILRLMIEKMLNDAYYDENGKLKYAGPWNLIKRFFLKEFKDFKYSFAGKFYNQPSIKYLSSKASDSKTFFSETKPSYITADNFADTIVQLLREKGAGVDDMQKIGFSLQFNTYHIQPESLKNLKGIFADSGTDINLFKTKLKAWFNEMNDRATGWYKRKLQLILFWLGFIIAVAFNVDSIQIARFLSKDKEARNQLANMGVALAKDTARYKDFVTANGNSINTEKILDSGYAHVSKDITEANLILGLGWPLANLMKYDSSSFYQKKDSISFGYVKINQSSFKGFKHSLNTLHDSLALNKKRADALMHQLAIYKRDTAIFRLQHEKDLQLKDTLRKKEKLIDTTANELQIVKNRNQTDSESLFIVAQNLQEITKDINSNTSNDFVLIDKIIIDTPDKKLVDTFKNNERAVIYGNRLCTTAEKVGYVLSKCNPFSSDFWSFIFSLQFLGFVITALMLSLGAPFWFDLLKKLVALRGSGVKPEEKEKKQPQQPADNLSTNLKTNQTNTSLPVQDNTEAALSSLTQKTKGEQGIVAVAKQYRPGTNAAYLVIIVENNPILQYMQNKYGNSETLNNGSSIPIEYSIDTPINVASIMDGSEIANQTGALGTGTLGCEMKKNESDMVYFISCWHVMKDNSNWDVSPIVKNITQSMNGNKTPIGVIEEGFLSHDSDIGIDIGIASYINAADATPNPEFLIAAQHRSVTTFDSLVNTPVKLYGKVCKLKNAQIFHDTINAHIKYPDGVTHLMNDVFSIVSKDPETGRKFSPTTGGDSGTVVTDINGVPLGMIIGGNGNFSYAIKFSNLFDPDKPLKQYFFKI